MTTLGDIVGATYHLFLKSLAELLQDRAFARSANAALARPAHALPAQKSL